MIVTLVYISLAIIIQLCGEMSISTSISSFNTVSTITLFCSCVTCVRGHVWRLEPNIRCLSQQLTTVFEYRALTEAGAH